MCIKFADAYLNETSTIETDTTTTTTPTTTTTGDYNIVIITWLSSLPVKRI